MKPISDAKLAQVEDAIRARDPALYDCKLPAEELVSLISEVRRLRPEVKRLRGMKCETCRHWKHVPDPCGKENDRYDCDLMSSGSSTPDHPESLACAFDADEYGAWVQTKPDYGCNQWRSKP